ncbi:MAG TPA: efflux RND transporter periplasmic adaptor subunit [Pirellulales bacterium]
MLALLVLLLAPPIGCHHAEEQAAKDHALPRVDVVCPERGALHWTVRQPGYIEAFEETPIFPKIVGYVETWQADIGDRVAKGDVLAKLWVPDLTAELKEKEAQIEQARKSIDVAEAQMVAAATLVDEGKAMLRRAQADFNFWKTQFQRISKLEASVIEKQVKEESHSQLQARQAGVNEAEAKLAYARAELKQNEALREKCRADVVVAEAARDRLQALLDYATLIAPFDGVVTRRHISTGNFVQPPAGADAVPLYVIERRDRVRVFVEVPETDAVWIQTGTRVDIRVQAVNGLRREGEVTRMAYGLERQSRTLLAEIDLSNDDDLLRPGMYVSAEIAVSRPDLLTLPVSAVGSDGDVNQGYQNFCLMVDHGKVSRCEVELGSRGDDRVEIVRKRVDGHWVAFDGDEQVIRGDLALSEGQQVLIETEQAKSKQAVADARVRR